MVRRSPRLEHDVLGVLLVAAWLALAPEAGAICNVIPAATGDFRGAVGSLNRPFAGPGDFVEVRVRPAVCDEESTGFIDLDGDESLSTIRW